MTDERIALILAGGFSSRMGQDKALLPWKGKPLLQRVGEAALSCCDRAIVLSPWCDRYRKIVQLPDDRCAWWYESLTGRGPLLAFQEGLQRLANRSSQEGMVVLDERSWVLLLACDLPTLDRDWLGEQSDYLANLPGDILASVPHRNQRWEPLCGFYRLAALKPLQAFADSGGRSFQCWLATIPVQPMTLDRRGERSLWNCNQPEDFANQDGPDSSQPVRKR